MNTGGRSIQLSYEPLCGGEGIRTLDTLAGMLLFKSSALNHSATPPSVFLRRKGDSNPTTSFQTFRFQDDCRYPKSFGLSLQFLLTKKPRLIRARVLNILITVLSYSKFRQTIGPSKLFLELDLDHLFVNTVFTSLFSLNM